MNPQDLAALARTALELVPDGARIGLGSGRTAAAFTRALADRVRQGLRVRCVPTSIGVGRLAAELGIPLDTLDADEPLEVTIDGADEVEPGTLHLIKGWGAALVRERIVAAASKRQVILVTPEKLVPRLGTRGRLPVEVLPFAEPFVRRRIRRLAGFGPLVPGLRQVNGQPLVTDNGNWIIDCTLEPQPDPAALHRALCDIPGVVQTGLFLGTAERVLVAEAGVVRQLLPGRP